MIRGLLSEGQVLKGSFKEGHVIRNGKIQYIVPDGCQLLNEYTNAH
jgi:hypothetical protein